MVIGEAGAARDAGAGRSIGVKEMYFGYTVAVGFCSAPGCGGWRRINSWVKQSPDIAGRL
jgi:hypothetical protein